MYSMYSTIYHPCIPPESTDHTEEEKEKEKNMKQDGDMEQLTEQITISTLNHFSALFLFLPHKMTYVSTYLKFFNLNQSSRWRTLSNFSALPLIVGKMQPWGGEREKEEWQYCRSMSVEERQEEERERGNTQYGVRRRGPECDDVQ